MKKNLNKLRTDIDNIEFMKESNRHSPTLNPANIFSTLKDVSNSFEKQDMPLLSPRRRRSRTPSPRKRRSRTPPRVRTPPRPRTPTPPRRFRSPSPKRRERSPSPYRSDDIEEKSTLLTTFHLLQQQGVKSDLKLDIGADIKTIRAEIKRMETELNSQKMVKFARKFLIAMVSGIEFLNARYDPVGLHLNGWSEHVMTTLGDYDSVFLRLYDKYKDHTSALAPEAELMLILGGSGLMFHLTQSFVNQNVPKFTEVAKEHPDLAEKIAGIMAKKYKDAPQDDSDDDSDKESVTTQSLKQATERVDNPHPSTFQLPTELLSTPAFPAIINKMVKKPMARPKAPPYPPMQTIHEVKEIEPDLPKLKEKNENVLVLG